MPINLDKLKEIRKRRGFTFDELAHRTGYSRNQIFRWEKGENDPTSAALGTLARALDVSVDYLLDFSDTPKEIIGAPLSDDEHRLIMAYRAGDSTTLLEIIVEQMKQKQKNDPMGGGESESS